MAHHPFPLWRPAAVATDAEPPDPNDPALRLPAEQAEWAAIFRYCAEQYHLSQEQVEGYEIWVLAELLESWKPPEDDGATDPEELQARSIALVEQRARAAGLIADADTAS